MDIHNSHKQNTTRSVLEFNYKEARKFFLKSERTFLFTTTEQDAVFPPSVVLTVIVVLPSDLAMTTPDDETSATEGALDDQVTDLFVALDGVTVAINV